MRVSNFESETLLACGGDGDLAEAEVVVDRFGIVSVDSPWSDARSPCRGSRTAGQAHGDEAAYRDYRDRYRAMATSLGSRGI